MINILTAKTLSFYSIRVFLRRNDLITNKIPYCHCEERSDEAISKNNYLKLTIRVSKTYKVCL